MLYNSIRSYGGLDELLGADELKEYFLSGSPAVGVSVLLKNIFGKAKLVNIGLGTLSNSYSLDQ